MKTIKGGHVSVLAVALLLLSTNSAFAGLDYTQSGHITYVENGWGGEGLAIHTDTGYGTAAPCGVNDFGISASHPSYKELVAIALSAYATGASVQLVLDQGTCVFGNRTKVLAIRLLK